jgi:L-alanine-DL-glutamate epimerase-like enolase superfamily enzyme
VGEDPLDREKIWQKIRTLDRWLALFPIYKAPSMSHSGTSRPNGWDALYKLIGGYRDSVRAYATAAWAIQTRLL